MHDLTNLFNSFLQTVEAFSSDAPQSTSKLNNSRGGIKGISSFDISNRHHLSRINIQIPFRFMLQEDFGQLHSWHTNIDIPFRLITLLNLLWGPLVIKEKNILSTRVSSSVNMSSMTVIEVFFNVILYSQQKEVPYSLKVLCVKSAILVHRECPKSTFEQMQDQVISTKWSMFSSRLGGTCWEWSLCLKCSVKC